jgi:hypothetical protein
VLTDSELIAELELREQNSYGGHTGDLEDERRKALSFYLGEQEGELEKPEGRSGVVLRDVLDTVEWILPSLLKIFFGGDKVIEFRPRGPEDVDSAEQETDVVNYVALEQNPDAFETFYCWFKDALLQKTGYVYTYWDESEDIDHERYQVSGDELALLLEQNPEVEIIAHEQQGDEHYVEIKRVTQSGRVEYCPIPPEEIRIDVNHRRVSLQECRYVQHQTEKSISEIRELGYDVPDDISDDDEYHDTPESVERDQYSESSWLSDDSTDPASRLVWIKTEYVRIDYDGDGLAELRRIVRVGKTILANEPADCVPYAALCPILMPHRHVGLSIYDLVQDLQVIRSTLMRNILDNVYFANNARHAINEDKVNLDDLLTNRPGGIVRVEGDPAGAILPLQAPALGNYVFNVMEFLDGVRENRTGVTRYNQGIDANSLNKTATGISQIMSAAQQRIELIARIFAETGVKDLFRLIHKHLSTHSKQSLTFRLRNEWIPVDPRQWKTRTDLSIAVGLGTGNKDQQLAHLTNILTFQKEAMLGKLRIVTEKNVYESAKALINNAGFKDADKFITDPETLPPQEPQPSPEQIKAETDMQQKQMEIDAKTNLEITKLQHNAQMESAKMEHDREMEAMRQQFELQVKQMDIQHQANMSVFDKDWTAKQEEGARQREAEAKDLEATEQQAPKIFQTLDELRQQFEAAMQQLRDVAIVAARAAAPKRVVRDPQTNRIVGVEPME